MTTLDRYILRTLVVNYLIALAVMLSLYTVLDLFFNIDEFTETNDSLLSVMGNIASYYGAHSFLYFSQLSGVITLFACMATLARMRRANELTAVLASGVSLYRVAVPVVAFGLGTSLFWYADTEVLKPRVGHLLSRSHDDASGSRSRGVWFVNDGPSSLLSAIQFFPAERRLEKLLVLHRDEQGAVVRVTEADEATWEAIPGHPVGGVWRLSGGVESRRMPAAGGLGPQERIESAAIDRYESRLNPMSLETRQFEQWLDHSSSSQLSEVTEREPALAGKIRRVKHGRFATPLVHMLLLLLGLPFFLSRAPANIINDAGKCLVVCGACYLLAYSGEHFVKTATYSAFPAWLPLIVFAPVAVVLIDRVRT